jgi:ABC-type glycerol-3-phosphate transport system substrate-binding protein
VIEGNWLLPYLAKEAPSLAYGVTHVPSGQAGRATIAFVTCYALVADTPNAEAASKLLEFLASADSQRAWIELTDALPGSVKLLDFWAQAHPDQQAFIQGLDHAYPWRFGPAFQPLIEQMNDGIQKIYGGFILADAVLAEIEAAGNKRLQAEER